MRHGRAKQARKTLQFFARITNNRIRPPYSILLDGTFLVALIQYKLHDEMTSRLHRLLQQHEHHGDHGSSSQMIQFITTRSTLIELQKLEQTVLSSSSKTADSENKALVFRQARIWAGTNCMRILESHDIPDESSSTSFDISAIPTTPSSVMQQGTSNKNNRRARVRGGNDISDLSLVGREFLRLAMAVLVQEQEDEVAKEKSATAAAVDDPTSTKDDEESGSSTKEEGGSSNRNSRREQGQQRRRDGKRPSHHQNQQSYRHCYYFVATQDEQVLDRLRHLGHVPIIRLARGSVLLLEQPSKAATQQAWREERLKWRLGVGTGTGISTTGNSNGAASSMLQQERNEAQRLVKEERQERRQREQQQHQQQQPYAARQKKRAKGPNPLSCKPGAKKKQKT